jgi:hypothetical protein
MALDMHSQVKIQKILQVEYSNNTVLIQVSYKVRRGRKLYKIWLLPADFRGTGLFPICYRRMPRYADVLDMHDNVIYTGSMSVCREIVRIANRHYIEGA